MDKRNFSNLEDEIKYIIQNAIHTKNFYQLNKDIKHTVKGAIKEVKNSIKDKHNKNFAASKHTSHTTTTPVPSNQTNYPSVSIGRVSGVLLTIFGWTLLITMGITEFALTLNLLFTGEFALYGTIIFGLFPLLLAGVFMTLKGTSIRNRLKRFYRYRKLFKNHNFYSIKDLAAHTGLGCKFVIKDLRKMISIGMFPEGHIDKQQTCIILNQDSFQQYLDLQKNLQIQSRESADQNKFDNNLAESSKDTSSQEENIALRTVIEHGNACIKQLKEANDAIPGEEISQKLNRLESVIDKIFEYVAKHPEQLPEIQKFMDYYLPTTLKLVNAYREFAFQPVERETITSAKSEIETTLDTINHAFETLLDSLFEDAAMDVSTDISVLETMLAQEGLTPNQFKPYQTSGGIDNE